MSKRRNAVSPRSRLETARSTRAIVRVRRAIPGADVIWGVVIAAGTRWVLLAKYDTIWFAFDGFVALRVADVRKVKFVTPGEPRQEEAVEIRATRASGEWPPPQLPGVSVDTTVDLLFTAGDRFDLVTIYTERFDAGVCYVGSVTEARDKTLEIRSITPDAVWEDDPMWFPFRDITRVDLGDRYATTLFQLSSSRPRGEMSPRQEAT